jgi:toxin ParE1/3/4
MTEIVLSHRAESDLAEIWHSIAEANPSAADRLLARISNRIEQLRHFPAIGAPRSDIAERVRLIAEGRYVILYETYNEVVEIVRVLHGARDIASELGRR